jgi:uncharacterized protein
MIIDADCHVSAQKYDALSIQAEDLIAVMDRAGVDKALIWLKPPYDKNIEPENRAIYEAAAAYPGRFLPMGWVNPRLGYQRAADTIRQCFETYGFLGIKFNGAQDDYVIDDDQLAMPLIELAVRYGKPLAFHIGADFYENTHPYRLKRIAQTFPETTFLMVHMGGAGKPPLARSALETAQACPNVVLIGSEIEERYILNAVSAVGAGRVCFGSDTPFGLMHVRLAMFRALLSDLNPQEQAMIMGGNIAQVFET